METASIGSAAIKLTDKILGYDSDDLADILKAIASEIGVAHISYLRFSSKRSEEVSLLTGVNTYSDEWGRRYFLKKYSDIDPVIRVGVLATATFDWDTLDRDDPAVRNFFEDAIQHGVGCSGLSIPLRRQNTVSVISFSSNLPKREWEGFKASNMTILQQLSALIDSAASTDRKLKRPPVQLSAREEQCLMWVARGKTHQEVAEVLDLTLGAVKTHLDTARRKLQCINLTHAVGVAVAMGIIPIEELEDRDNK